MIHSSAIVDPGARLADGVTVGPYSIIGPDVEIGESTEIGPHVVIKGPTTIGRNNRIYQFCSIGEDPQDKKYAGESTRLAIGDGNTIRECCTINRGTSQDRGVTELGDDNWVMAYVHVAHDCVVGNHTVLANCATLAGHVTVGDHAILGGFTKVHQFCRVGMHAFCGMDSGLNRDVPPYVTVSGMPAEPKGINAEGLKRHGFDREAVRVVRQAYRLLYRSGLRLEEALEQIRSLGRDAEVVAPMIEFIETSSRGLTR